MGGGVVDEGVEILLSGRLGIGAAAAVDAEAGGDADGFTGGLGVEYGGFEEGGR